MISDMKGFDYFKLALSKYAEFEGRSRRKEYWYFALFNIIITYGIALIETLLWDFPILSSLVSLGLIVPGIAVGIRRLHDIGKSGWYVLIGLIPLIGFILLIVWFCTDSQPGSNKWGPNPKEEGDTVHDHLIEQNDLV